MCHQDLLNQELSNLISKVIVCQKIVRGYLCRKRLLTLLDRVHSTKEEKFKFIQQIHLNSELTKEKLMDQLKHHNRIKHSRISRSPAPPPPPPPMPHVSITTNIQQNSAAAAASAALTSNNNNKDNYKIQNLKNKIENQMKSYAKQEDYEEMLKLVKVNINLEFCYSHLKL